MTTQSYSTCRSELPRLSVLFAAFLVNAATACTDSNTLPTSAQDAAVGSVQVDAHIPSSMSSSVLPPITLTASTAPRDAAAPVEAGHLPDATWDAALMSDAADGASSLDASMPSGSVLLPPSEGGTGPSAVAEAAVPTATQLDAEAPASADAALPDAGVSADAGTVPSTLPSVVPTLVPTVVPPVDPYEISARCSSNVYWDGPEGDTMFPGQACNSCHAFEEEGPIFAIAGTLYPTAHEPDDCLGLTDGAHVLITDANGTEHELLPNSSGNFMIEHAIALPYRASVVTDDGIRTMLTPQTNGDCNSCHSQSGRNGARGRVFIP